MMDHVKTILWRNVDNTSLEYASLYSGIGGFVLEGTIILVLEQLATTVTYRIECDSRWRTRYVELSQGQAEEISRLTLVADETQRWQQNRSPLPLAHGLFEVDFEISPVTNSLPIRRLNLKVGESAESTAVWLQFPSLKLERLKQQYTRINDRFYRYEAPELGFKAQLEVDEDGLIVKYGDLWMRIA